MTHELAILPINFKSIIEQKKTCDVCHNDRNFKVNDWICLREFDGSRYTGNSRHVFISHILTDAFIGIKKGYCVLSITLLPI